MVKKVEFSELRWSGVETCEYIGPAGYLWSKGNKLFWSDSTNSSPEFFAAVPCDPAYQPFLKNRLGRRLARQSFTEVIPLDGLSRIFFAYDRSIGLIEDGNVSFLGGRSRQTRLLRNGAARLPNGDILFGEYWSNPKREPVSVYRYNSSSSSLEVAFTFAAGEIRHVHSVNWDPYSERVYVACGDVGAESRIISFKADMSDMQVLVEGDEGARSISLLFDGGNIYFGTDAEFRQNSIRKYSRKTGQLSDIAEVNGPVFYSAPWGEGWLIASTAELCPSQTSPEAILYYLDRSDDSVTRIVSFKKDRLPKGLFQLGTISFPRVEGAPKSIAISGNALRGMDGRVVVVS